MTIKKHITRLCVRQLPVFAKQHRQTGRTLHSMKPVSLTIDKTAYMACWLITHAHVSHIRKYSSELCKCMRKLAVADLRISQCSLCSQPSAGQSVKSVGLATTAKWHHDWPTTTRPTCPTRSGYFRACKGAHFIDNKHINSQAICPSVFVI